MPYLQRKPTAPWAARGTHVTSVTSRPRDVVRHTGTGETRGHYSLGESACGTWVLHEVHRRGKVRQKDP